MKRLIISLLFFTVYIVQYGQIIADHTVVDRFDDIPQYYIDEVKKMWLSYAGQSHALGLVWGLGELKKLYPVYDASVTTSGIPEAYTTTHLRASAATWGSYFNSTGWYYDTGEEEWFTNSTGRARIKTGITYSNTHNLEISAIGFGWCWDHTAGPDLGGVVTTGTDPVYGCHWFGRSNYGPSGGIYAAWGINSDDYAVTNNVVSMDTYIEATQEYIDYCKANNYKTRVFFTTGPVDNYEGRISNEALYQGYLKNERVREYVRSGNDRIIFDYADILCYDDDGTPTNLTWNGKSFPGITAKNAYPINMGHISDAGNIRLAKAMWWMLARIAGWDGGTTGLDSPKTDISATFINTTREEINILIEDPLINVTISLFSLSGELLDKKMALSNTCTFDTAHLSPGVYLVVLSDYKKTQTHKVIVY